MRGHEGVRRVAIHEHRRYNEGLLLEERITIAAALLVDLSILAFSALGEAGDIFALNLCIIASILGVAILQRRVARPWATIFRDWYVPAFLIVIFLENRRLIPLFNPHCLDVLLMEMDTLLFLGHSPVLIMEKINTPLLTEIFQLSYVSFYFLPFCLCLNIYLKEPVKVFHINASTILMGFYLSYIGYYITPVMGPRFTLEHLQAVPLQGMFLADAIRGFIEMVEGNMADCFPSGHAMISLLTVLLARRYARGFFPIAVIWFLIIQFSTIYLHYHYVTDLAAGWLLGLLTYSFGPKLAEALIRGDPD
jgi:membrane-associated phospholipid phosphatase